MAVLLNFENMLVINAAVPIKKTGRHEKCFHLPENAEFSAFESDGENSLFFYIFFSYRSKGFGQLGKYSVLHLHKH